MSAIEDGEIAQRDIAGEFEGDGLVGAAISAGQSLAADQSAANDGNIFKTLAPDEAVVKVAVAEILELFKLIGLGGVVSCRVGGCFDARAVLELQRDVAAQANRSGQVGSGGK